MNKFLFIENVYLRDCIEQKVEEIQTDKKEDILCICGNKANPETFIISGISKTEFGYEFQNHGNETFCSDLCLQHKMSKFNYLDRYKYEENIKFKNKIINLL